MEDCEGSNSALQHFYILKSKGNQLFQLFNMLCDTVDRELNILTATVDVVSQKIGAK